MKEYKGWWTPDYCTEAVDYVIKEWDSKGTKVLEILKNKRTVIQAGGNLGIFPKKLSAHFETVYCYEPIDVNFECLIKNLDGIQNIKFFEKGLSNHNHKASISWQAPKNSGAIRLSEDTEGMELISIDSQEISNVDLIWLDLEGFEYKALQGAKNTIEKNKPVLVVENNGLIHEFQGTNKGNDNFRKIMKTEFKYKFHSRLMRDDVYVPEDF